MPDHFEVTEESRRDALVEEPRSAIPQTPCFVGRAAAAPAADPEANRWNGRSPSSGGPAQEYGSTDRDGGRPGVRPGVRRRVAEVQDAGREAGVTGYR